MKKITILIVIAAISSTSYGQSLKKFYSERKWGFKDKSGKIVIPPKYTRVSNFANGICAVTETARATPNQIVQTKWKILNSKGEQVLSEEFDKVTNRKNSPIFVENNNKTGVIDKNGKYILSVSFENVRKLGNGFYKLSSKELGNAVVNSKGLVVIKPQKLFRIRESIGCGLFSYSNVDSLRKESVYDISTGRMKLVYSNSFGGIVDSELNIIMNQDSVDFIPSTIVNKESCSNKKNLFGLTAATKSNYRGIYRVGQGIVVPIEYKLAPGNSGARQTYKIKPNIIEINLSRGGVNVAKYNWQGKELYKKIE